MPIFPFSFVTILHYTSPGRPFNPCTQVHSIIHITYLRILRLRCPLFPVFEWHWDWAVIYRVLKQRASIGNCHKKNGFNHLHTYVWKYLLTKRKFKFCFQSILTKNTFETINEKDLTAHDCRIFCHQIGFEFLFSSTRSRHKI